MRAYDCFARFYDEMMADAPYEKWQTFFLQTVERYRLKKGCLADIGCGTGTLSLFFADKGYEVFAVDPAPNMLVQLEQKLTGHYRDKIHLFEQDAASLELPAQVHIAVSFCDSFNYITDEKELEEAFRRVYDSLAPKGVFLFDMHTPYKIKDVYGDSLYVDEAEEYTYIWETRVETEACILQHELVFFVEETNGLYRKYTENHQQRAYGQAFIRELLVQAGFKSIQCYADFSFDSPTPRSERYFFIAVK